ncbi:MAG: hypothetical protein IID16_00780 [Candidatus Marinimicrobia bacterium]|nr:hypothetical protein [Candidatus Neomarinimicrobiota bacterium]
MKTHLQKIEVCDRCFSDRIIDTDCQCCIGNVILIELEFDVCHCCCNVIDDGQPADTEFNREKYLKLKKQRNEKS